MGIGSYRFRCGQEKFCQDTFLGRVRWGDPMQNEVMKTMGLLVVVGVLSLGCEKSAEVVQPPSFPAQAAPHAPYPVAAAVPPTASQPAPDFATQQREAMAKMQADAVANGEAYRKQREANEAEKQRLFCESSRTHRAEIAQADAREWWRWIGEAGPHVKWMRTCKLKDTTGIRVEREQDGNATVFRVRHVGEPDAVICPAGRPKGITDDDVRVLLEGVYADPEYLSSPVTSAGGQCIESDAAVGLVISGVKRNDMPGIKRLIDWKAP